jgi:hypothetical protein
MKERSVLVENVDTGAITSSATAIYTAPLNTRSKVMYIRLCNDSGGAITGVDVDVYNGVGISIASNQSLSTDDSLDIIPLNKYIILEPSNELRVRASATGVSCIVTLEETSGLVSTN